MSKTPEEIARTIFYLVRDWTRADEQHYAPVGYDAAVVSDIAAAIREREQEHAAEIERLKNIIERQNEGIYECKLALGCENPDDVSLIDAIKIVREREKVLADAYVRATFKRYD